MSVWQVGAARAPPYRPEQPAAPVTQLITPRRGDSCTSTAARQHNKANRKKTACLQSVQRVHCIKQPAGSEQQSGV